MPPTVSQIKDKLVEVIAKNGTVRDMSVAAEAITLLEGISVTKEDLEKTRLGLYVNIVRKAAKDNPLAKRAKNLIKSWQQMIVPGTPQVAQRRMRPQTPNSVGSSPSPPDPAIYNAGSNCAPVSVTPPVFPSSQRSQGNTPTVPDNIAKKTKQPKEGISKTNKSNRTKLKSPLTVPLDDGLKRSKVQGSEIKSSKSEKLSPDSGQHMVSVVNPNTNGLKLTFKMQPGMQTTLDNDEEAEIEVVSDGNHQANNQWRHDMLERTQDETKHAPTPHRRDGRKKHKKKKSHKSPKSTPSSPQAPIINSPMPISKTLPSQEDLYNNNNKQPRMITSQSMPNFTVTKQSATKNKSPEKISKNDIAGQNISSDFKKTAIQNSHPNLKRKRDAMALNSTPSPSSSQEDKPRSSKERRLTLTYDPMTGQLQQKTSERSEVKNDDVTAQEEKPEIQSAKQVPSRTEIKKIPEKLQKSDQKETKAKILPQKPHKNDSVPIDPPKEGEYPTSIVPAIAINHEINEHHNTRCNGDCSSAPFKTRRLFRKRKTRRKDGVLDLPSLFPISNLVTMTTQSDSEENSDSESGFMRFLGQEAKSDVGASSSATHSGNCEWSGVTGCRGNNGAWYDWLETFCVRNKDENKTQLLPNEEQLMPLHILPYVELD